MGDIGESIAVRPATRIERTFRWIRRSPAQATLSGLLVLILVASLGILWQFKQLRQAQAETLELAERSASNAQLSRVLNLIERDPTVADKILTQIPVERRDLAWGILQYRMTADDIEWTNSGHSAEILSIQFSEDGKRFFTTDQAGIIIARDVNSGQLQFESKLPDNGERWTVQVYGDSNRVVVHRGVQSDDQVYFMPDNCYVWDLLKNQVIFDGKATGPSYGAAHLSPAFLSHDGKSLVVVELRGNTVGVWDTDSGKERFRVIVPGDLRNTIPGADGTILTLALNGSGCELCEWNMTDGRQISARPLVGLRSKLPSGFIDTYVESTFHHSRFLSLSVDSKTYFYDLVNDVFLGTGQYVTPSGEVIAVHHNRRTLTALKAGSEPLTVPLATNGVKFQVDGPTMISLNEDSTLSFWDAGRGEEQLTLPVKSHSLKLVKVSPRRDAVVVADDSGRLAILRVAVPSKAE